MAYSKSFLFIARNQLKKIFAAALIAGSVFAPQAHAVDINAAIHKVAAKYDLEPALIKAVIQAESGFNQNARSPAGAIGLMQIMPATARNLGIRNVQNPVNNLEAGARYLRYLKNMFGSTQLALAAYNAGEGNVRKYGNRIPPFKETRRYVPKVLGYYNRYKRGS